MRGAIQVVLAVLAIPACVTQDHAARLQRLEECIEAKKQTIAAMTARDWSALKQQAYRKLAACAGDNTSDSLSDSYKDIAIANRELGLYEETLAAADACIGARYSNSGCHLIRAQALLALERRDEARTSLEYAARIARLNMEAAGKARAQATTSIETERAISVLSLSRAELELIETLRVKHFAE